jgi:hypothetical protein
MKKLVLFSGRLAGENFAVGKALSRVFSALIGMYVDLQEDQNHPLRFFSPMQR